METQIRPLFSAREIARAIFLEYYPEGTATFDIAWEVLSEVSTDRSIPQDESAQSVLGIVGRPDSAERDMALLVAILFETVIEESSLVRETVLERLERACKRHGKADAFKHRLKESIAEKFAEEPQFIVWTSEEKPPFDAVEIATHSHGPDTKAFYLKTGGENEAFEAKQRFDLFVQEHEVFLGCNHGTRVRVQPLGFGLLVLLLRFKGREISPEKAYHRVWTPNAKQIPDLSAEQLRDLTTALSRLHAAINFPARLFRIRKVHNNGYKCEGDLSFCVIMRRDDELISRLMDG